MGSAKRRASRRKSKTSQKLRFPIGEFAQRKQDLKENYLSKSKELAALRKKLNRIKEKIKGLNTEIEGEGRKTSAPVFAVSESTAFARKKNPTELSPEGKILNIPQRSKNRRQLETLLASVEIHGGTQEHRHPALDGMFSSLDKYCNVEGFKLYIGSSKKLRNASIDLANDAGKSFEKSQDNIIRSFSLLYAGGLVSKRKYEQARSALGTQSIGSKTSKGYLSRKRLGYGGGIRIPRILSYKDLMSKVNSIDIGELISIRETLCSDLPAEQRVDGVYRNLENMLICLAEFYLQVDPYRKEEDRLRWFGGKKGEFKVALGGDGAPFGKYDESMSWLVSFLNAGPRMASPNDNFLLFGANCKETHAVVTKFTRLITQQCAAIELKTFTVCDLQVKFTFELIPSDMKFLAFLNGELSNSATYFSSFANVCLSDIDCLQGTFGTTSDCKWKPWEYNERVKVAQKVTEYKENLPNKLASSTKRSRVTKFIANQRSRQEFKPLIGNLCDNEVLEPLHLKNNAVQKLHGKLLDLALSTSNLPPAISSLSEIPQSPIRRYIEAMEVEVKATRLKKQLVKWLIEERTKDKEFSYRFTGKDSRLILHGFMYLVNALRGNSTNPVLLTKLLVIVFIAINLRDSAALFSMYHFSNQKLQQLHKCTHDYFIAIVLFGDVPSPSEWSIGKLVATHTQWMFERYGVGLGINTMQGREAKHVQIASYAKHSHFKNRWFLVFRHDFISKIWLPLLQPSLLNYQQRQESLVPDRVSQENSLSCHCGFLKQESREKCFYCDHEIMIEIVKSVENCKLTSRLAHILR